MDSQATPLRTESSSMWSSLSFKFRTSSNMGWEASSPRINGEKKSSKISQSKSFSTVHSRLSLQINTFLSLFFLSVVVIGRWSKTFPFRDVSVLCESNQSFSALSARGGKLIFCVNRASKSGRFNQFSTALEWGRRSWFLLFFEDH